MTPLAVTLTPQSTVREALLAFRQTRLAGIPVIDGKGFPIVMFTRSNLDECLLLQGVTLETRIKP